ncbi:hypothetical protein ABTK55_20265, partial [Acinetobacter baumannii]
TIVFWFSLLSLPPLAIAFALTATAHPWQAWALMACVGLIGGVAQLMMTGALGAAPVSIVVPMDYSGLIWAALLGWAI